MIDLHSIKPVNGQVTFDLGWLIQNDKISDAELCTYLLNETSPEIDRLVNRILKSPADRIAVVDQIIFTLLVRRRSYKGKISGKAWLYKLIFDECVKLVPQIQAIQSNDFEQAIKAFDTSLAGEAHFNQFMESLTPLESLIVILYYGHNLILNEIAFLLKIDIEPLQTNLESSQQKLMIHQQACQECTANNSNLASMEAALSNALHSNSQLIETARKNYTEWSVSLLGRLDQEKQRRRSRKWFSRAVEMCLGLLLVVIAEWSFTHTWPKLPWLVAPTQSVITQDASFKATPQPVPTIKPLPPTALNGPEKAIDEIVLASLTSWARWKTLWADVRVTNYQLANFSDGTNSVPERYQRKQIWLAQPESSLVIIGPTYSNPDLTYSISNGFMSGQNYASGHTIEQTTTDIIPDLDLKKLFSPMDIFPPGGKLTRVGFDMVAERPAWVVEWKTNFGIFYRLWIDQQYGIVLRRLEFADGLYFPVISEIVVTKIYFDGNFSPRIFEPFQYKGDYFATDFSGDPEIKDVKSALQNWSTPAITWTKTENASPAAADYSSSRLSFKTVPAEMQKSFGTELELFADHNDLGRLPLGGKAVQTCERSPDGSRIAYNSPPKNDSGDTTLLIADLANIQSTRPALLDGITSGDFAFSPDNHHLAFFGCEKATKFCGVFILDLMSWKLTRLTPLTFADYIFWSPDGRSIALVGNDDRNEAQKIIMTKNLLMNEVLALLHTWYFQVIDVTSGDITYKRAFSWSNLNAPSDSPTHSWNQAFKIPSAGVKNCIDPPGEVVSN